MLMKLSYGIKYAICYLGTGMTPGAKFKESNLQFANSGTRMTPNAKYKEPNQQFASSGTGMTQRDKFEGR